MFLRPHHLQQHDLYLESREIAYLRAIENHAWGLVRFELKEESLSNFSLVATSLRAVFPDGTLVDVPGNARLSGRTLDRKALETGRELDVAVGVRRIEGRRSIVAPDGSPAGQARMAAVVEEVYDLDAGRDPVSVEYAEYDLQWFLADEPTLGFETLPVARLLFTGDPARPLQAAPVFAPPALMLSAAPALQESARAVVERLSTVLREKGEVRGSDQAGEIILFQALSGTLPVLRDMIQDGNIHPRMVYKEMARLAGALHFRDVSGRSFDDIPVYDHSNPGPVFDTLRKLITELSKPEIVKRYRRLPMERLAGDLFRAGIPAEAKAPGVRAFLEVAAMESTPRVKALVQTAKISAPPRIETLKQFALPGVATEPMPGPPPELPAGSTGSFFRLKVEEGNEWPTQVLKGDMVVAFILGAPQDLKLTLVLVLPTGS